MRLLPDDIKQQIIVEVDLSYSYQIEATDKVVRIAEILKEHGLEPIISDGYGYGPCKNLKCKGGVNLLTAEIICQQLHDIPTHSRILYKLNSNLNFILTD